MTTAKDILQEIARYESGMAADQKWRDKYVARIDARLAEKQLARRKELSPMAARWIAQMRDEGCDFDPEVEAKLDAISPRLMVPPPATTPPVVIDDKPKKAGAR